MAATAEVGPGCGWATPAPDRKSRILDALGDPPEDAAIEDAIERPCFLARVEKGLPQLDAGEGLDQVEVERRFAR